MVWLLGIIILIFLIIVLQLNAIISFKEERNYIKMEINRSLDDKKRLFWKNELKKLYLGSMPIIGRIIK